MNCFARVVDQAQVHEIQQEKERQDVEIDEQGFLRSFTRHLRRSIVTPEVDGLEAGKGESRDATKEERRTPVEHQQAKLQTWDVRGYSDLENLLKTDWISFETLAGNAAEGERKAAKALDRVPLQQLQNPWADGHGSNTAMRATARGFASLPPQPSPVEPAFASTQEGWRAGLRSAPFGSSPRPPGVCMRSTASSFATAGAMAVGEPLSARGAASQEAKPQTSTAAAAELRSQSPVLPGMYVGNAKAPSRRLSKSRRPMERPVAWKARQVSVQSAMSGPGSVTEKKVETVTAGAHAKWKSTKPYTGDDGEPPTEEDKAEDHLQTDEYNAWKRKVVESARSLQMEIDRFRLEP
eukprot:TRINITY_DN93543_c0_g1_i1.p1 TRINITY_DN93543_c0_g1~~TRINITY_DN93543_c0_g1_i1.p1  ORF type:complete len:352 (+),score=90.46 TRINITY_DN93543_c0_g1_i1:165-1220(+)